MALGVLGLGGLGSWGLQLAYRQLRFFIGDPALGTWVKLSFGLLQAIYWFFALWIAASQVRSLDPLRFLVSSVLGVGTGLAGQVWQAPIITVDKMRFSLGTLLVLLVLALAVFWASRVLAGLFKRLVLARLNLTVGSQEAIATAFNYTLSSIGYLLLLPLVGLDLGSLAILFGVVGIGFGLALQNLARNFISGLVLLIERPVQVGDFIHLKDGDGVVESVNLRATTLRRFDGARLVIPNSTLIENSVLNWSNPEGRVRLSIEILVADSSDPQVVTEVLLKIAGEELRVISTPSPEVIYRGWQERGMLFELWAWCNYPKEQLRIKSALLYKIDSELRGRSIQYPVPLQDIRLSRLNSPLNLETESHVQPNGRSQK